jgi:hypothetical protein
VDLRAERDDTYFVPGIRYHARVEPKQEYGVSECIVDGQAFEGSGPDSTGTLTCWGHLPDPGIHELRVHFLGNPFYGESVSQSVQFEVTDDWRVLDLAAPTVTGPTNRFSGPVVLDSKSPVHFTWTGSDPWSGVDHYQLALSTDGGSYSTLSSSLTSPSYARRLAPGHTYRARARAIDKAGNVGAWAYGSSFRLTAYQESSARISWSGSWHTASGTSYWGGHERYATAAGAKASLTFAGRNVAWVGSVGPTRGWARVYINGVYVKSISLYAASAASRRVLFTKSWSSSATRTITIRVSGTTGHPRVDLDAFVVAS